VIEGIFNLVFEKAVHKIKVVAIEDGSKSVHSITGVSAGGRWSAVCGSIENA
jgi:hypothetical protein